ncbi:MAG: tyrosine-type recombinase/integrase [Dongiaceae bacterium]
MKGHIRQRGKKSWELKFDAGRDPATGARQIQYVSFRGTKREAQVKLAELIAAVSKSEYVEPNKITVAAHVSARIAHWEAAGDISAKTAERYGELAENQIIPHLGPKLLQKLRPLDIEAWHATLRTAGRKDGAGGVSGRTIINAHRVLSKALREAARHDLVLKNVAAEEGAPKAESDEIVILTEDEFNVVMTKLPGRALYVPAITSLCTGLRRGELLAGRRCSVDFNAKVFKVREALEETKKHGVRFKATKTKSGRRDVSLPDVVVEALREHMKRQLEERLALGIGKPPDDALLFPAPLSEEPQSPRQFSKRWDETAEAIGLGKITFHALRHTHASHLIDAGIDVVKISKRLGHASPNITLQIYAHLFQRREDKVADAINSVIDAALAGRKAS